MNCNFLKLLAAVVSGANTFPTIKNRAPDVRNPQHKLAVLVETGHLEIDSETGEYIPTAKALKVAPPPAAVEPDPSA